MSDGIRRALPPRVAIVLGLVFPLVMPWGFWRTGEAIWAIAQRPDAGADFWALYMEIMWAFRFFLVAYAIGSTGRLLVAWGAVRDMNARREARHA